MDCFASLAMTEDTLPRSRDALRPRFARKSSPPKNQRAQGMPDARCTRGPVRNAVVGCAHEHTGQRRQSDIPCAVALRLITCGVRLLKRLCRVRPVLVLRHEARPCGFALLAHPDFAIGV